VHVTRYQPVIHLSSTRDGRRRAHHRRLNIDTDTPAPEVKGLRLRLLGPAAWCRPGGDWQLLSRKDAALLARLALEGTQARTALATWLWPDVPQPRAHANLRQRLMRLRRQMGEWVHESDGVLQLQASVRCDLTPDVCRADAAMESPLLAGLDGADDAVQAWLGEARQHWQTRRADLMLGLASGHESRGELAAALAMTERLLSLEPLLEHAWRRLMRLHSQRGDRAAALAAFERCEQVLRSELGVLPGPETLACLHDVETGQNPGPALTSALPASLVRPPRQVGREPERAAMAAAWQLGVAFVLLGDAGLGKSRLLLDWAAAASGCVIEAARPGDEAVPYGAIVRLLRRLQRQALRADALWPDAVAAPQQRRELARLLPELGAAPAAPGLQALLMEALDEVFRRAPAAGVKAVLVDDLHHADAASLAVLQRASALPGLQWGFASRPAPHSELGRWLASSSRLRAVHLAGLSVPALQDLLGACRLPGLDSPAMAHNLHRHCAGNPLFVLETLRHLVLQGVGPTPPGGPATPRPEDLPLPPSVEALLTQRLRSLSPAAQALAQVAAVAAADFEAELAADVLGQPLLTLAEPWRELEAAQVLQRDGYVHEMLLEAARRGLPEALRRPLHARVAHCLRRRGAEPQRVAVHFRAAGLWLEAGETALAAAARARSLGRLQERLERVHEAADAFAQAGQPAAEFEARALEVTARYALDGPAPALALLDELLPLAPHRQARVRLHLERAGLLLSQYRSADCRAAAQAALALADAGSDDALSACLLDAAALAQSGDAQAAAAQVGTLRTRLLALTDPLLAVNLWGYLAMVYALAGRLDEGIDALQMQRRLAQASGQADDEATALSSLAGQYAQRGDVELAVAEGLLAVQLQTRLGAGLARAGALLNLAVAQVSLYALRDALQTLQQVHEAAASLPGVGAELACIAQDTESELWLRAHQPQRAAAALQALPTEGVSAPRELGRQAQQARVLQALGQHTEAQAMWQQVLQAPPGALPVLRAQLLAVQALGPQAAPQLPPLLAAARAAPLAYQALACWVQADMAWRQGDAPAALAAAQALSELLPRARHTLLPEAEARRWLLLLRRRLGPAQAAQAERIALRAWRRQVLVPALRQLSLALSPAG